MYQFTSVVVMLLLGADCVVSCSGWGTPATVEPAPGQARHLRVRRATERSAWINFNIRFYLIAPCS
jgi:hypothetical protein